MSDQSQADMARMPSHDQMAEESLLGAMLRDNLLIRQIEALLLPEDFYGFARRKVFECAIDLVNHEKSFDLVTAADWLKARKLIEEIGGYGYLAHLWDASPCAANAEHHARIIRKHSVVRKLVHAGNEIAKKAVEHIGDPEELIDEIEAEIFSISRSSVIGETTTLAVAVDEEVDRYDAASKNNGNRGLSTNIIDLDRVIGGLQDSELILLAARPSVGKTSLALQFAQHLAVAQQVPVFFSSLEMHRQELAARMMCAEASVDSHKYRTFMVSPDEVGKLLTARDVLHTGLMFIDDNSSQSVVRIAGNARRLKMKHDIRLVIIDYLQLIDTSEKRGRSRQEEVSNISRSLKRLARELRIPVLALAQLNRNTEEHERPKLSDLRESGSLEQDADTVLMLYRQDKDRRNEVTITVAKQRNGPAAVDIDVIFNQKTMTFSNAAMPHQQDI